MKKWIAFLLLAGAAYAGPSQPVAKLAIRITPGFDVIVDGTPYGKTTVEEGGKLLQLPAGSHHVVVRSVDGREGSFDVVLNAGESRDVSLSPLGLRKKLATSPNADTTGALRVACIPEDCTVTFKPPVDAVPPGRYPVVVSRGNASLRTDVDIPESTIVTVEANFTAGTIKTVDSRRRPRKLAVTEANDPLSRLAIPPHWKTAIRAALPGGVTILDAGASGNAVRVTLRVASEAAAIGMINGIYKSTTMLGAVSATSPHLDKDGSAIFDLVFVFPGDS